MPTSVPLDVKSLLRALERDLAQAGPCAVAVSGGVDSRVLAAVAARANPDVALVHFRGPHVPPWETSLARERMPSLVVQDVDPLALPDVAMNRRDRCLHCKRHMFDALARRMPGRVLLDGSNASDSAAYRPGLRALEELGVRSPLAEHGLDKAAVRALAGHLGLDDPEQASAPCLLTRLPYDTAATRETLARVARLEEDCRARGFSHCRVRLLHGQAVLFAHPRHQGLDAPLPVRWDLNLSGYWDRAVR